MHWYSAAGDLIIWAAGVWFGAAGIWRGRRFGRRIGRGSFRRRADWRGRRII